MYTITKLSRAWRRRSLSDHQPCELLSLVPGISWLTVLSLGRDDSLHIWRRPKNSSIFLYQTFDLVQPLHPPQVLWKMGPIHLPPNALTRHPLLGHLASLQSSRLIPSTEIPHRHRSDISVRRIGYVSRIHTRRVSF